MAELHFFTGTMDSGKSTLALQTNHNHAARGRVGRVFTAHDYKAPGRDSYAWESTVAEQRARNPHVKDGITEEEFVAMREARDAKLSPPALLVPSIQVNMRAGRFPPAESNGVRYLKLPVKGAVE